MFTQFLGGWGNHEVHHSSYITSLSSLTGSVVPLASAPDADAPKLRPRVLVPPGPRLLAHILIGHLFPSTCPQSFISDVQTARALAALGDLVHV